MIYGYCRVSTPKQKLDRQIYNIEQEFPTATIYKDNYTGTMMHRPAWDKLITKAEAGDTIVFDEVSRMSRNAEEGFAMYKTLYSKGISLVFLKEPMLNTDCFKSVLQISMTGGDEDIIIEAVNKYLLKLAERQIEVAFAGAQKEIDMLHKRTSEGVLRAQANGKQVGRAYGVKVETAKSKKAKRKLRTLMDKGLSDADLMKALGVSRNSLKKYRKELIWEDAEKAGTMPGQMSIEDYM